MVGMHVLFGEVMYYVDGFGGCEKGGAGAVAEAAEVAVVGDDMDGGVPGGLAGCIASGPDVVDGADVAAVETEAGPGVEHVFVGLAGLRERKGVGGSC